MKQVVKVMLANLISQDQMLNTEVAALCCGVVCSITKNGSNTKEEKPHYFKKFHFTSNKIQTTQ